MKTLLDWMFKSLSGAIAVGVLLVAAGPHIFPLTLPIVTAGGRALVLDMPDAVGFIVLVFFAAAFFYVIGYGIWRATGFLWSKF
jgi:hypothetical protein